MRIVDRMREVARGSARISCALLIGLLTCSVMITPVHAERVAPERAFALVSEGALLLDVRSESEYAAAHLPGSQLIPHTELAGRAAELGVSPETPIVVYCRSGRRADQAIETLKAKGFRNLYNAGGVTELLPLWRSPSKQESL